MPYINQELRDEWEIEIDIQDTMSTGELNYVITRILQEYIRQHGIRYSTFNDVVGVLECAKIELYRRLIANYEDQKIAENGDVY